MSLFDKIKDFFYDDEDYDEEIEENHPIAKKGKTRVVELEEDYKDKNKEISERELFKSERTFNFPMNVDDSIKTDKEDINNNVNTNKYRSSYTNYSDIRSYTRYNNSTKETNKVEEVKKFKPTPVISPIYGILDKNYKKEDVMIDATREFTMPSKSVDYDSVRKRAYANIYEEQKDDSSGIFFNLDDKKSDDEDEDVKIIYNDVTFDDEEDLENVTIGQKQEEYEKTIEESKIDEDQVDDEDQILSETKEQDLFNLIDNMYNSDDEDEEEE